MSCRKKPYRAGAGGQNILESIGFTERLAQRIAERTGTKPEVMLAAQAGAVSAAEWEKRVLEKVPAPRFEEKRSHRPLRYRALT